MGNYLYRLKTCLNFLATSAADLKRLDDVEVMMTDWGSEIPLRDALELSPEAAQMTTFVEVSEEAAKKVYPEGAFYPSGAYNASIRRATGKFIMLTDSDCMIPPQGMETLMRILSGEIPFLTPLSETFFYIRRYQIPWENAQRQPSVQDWRRYIQFHAGALRKELSEGGMLGGYAAAQLMHRDRWHETRAYDENLKGWGWCDNEIMIRMNQKYPWVDLISHGIYGLHMEHWSRNSRKDTSRKNINPMQIHYKMEVNDAHWGLANHDFPMRKATPAAITQEHDFQPLKGSCFDREQFQKELYTKDTLVMIAWILKQENVSPEEREAVLALATFCVKEYPRNMLYVGELLKYSIATVFQTCPGIESYFLAPWKEGITNAESFNPDKFSEFLGHVKYCGYGRFLTVPWDRMDDSLDAALGTSSNAELIFLHRPTLAQNFEEVFPKLLSRLAPGGVMIVFEHETKDAAFCSKHTATLKTPCSLLTFSSERVSMIAKAPTA
ncbi:MAG: glycosyltransferase family A protein [Verrucomicrobiota bacterium]